MELTMKINDQVLDSVRVYIPMCEDERYLAWMKKELLHRHYQTLLKLQSEPIFFLSKHVNE